MLELPVHNQREPPVKTLMLYVTEDCNLRCKYCFVKKTPRQMSPETARRSVDYLLQRSISGGQRQVAVSFFGGEPLLRTDLIAEVIEYTRARPGRTSVQFGATTNGTLAGPKVEKVVRDGALQLLISLDGDREVSRDRPLVSGAESYAMVARNLKRLVEWSPGAAVRMTYTPEHLNLVQRVEHAIELGAPWVILCPVTESDWSGQEQRVEQAHQELGDWFLREMQARRPPPLEVTWKMLLQHHRNGRARIRPNRPCQLASELLAVDPDGNVLPCHRHLYRRADWLGTVADRELPPERHRYTSIRSSQLSVCDSCDARFVCGGGCRVVALEGGYGLLGVHPNHCLITRAHHRMVERIYTRLSSDELFLKQLYHPPRLSSALQELAQAGN